jgi:regulatory protein
MDARRILDRMTALCSRSECCPGDVRAKIEKLASSCEEPVDVDGMMKTLQDEGYLNENRYSEAFACDKAYLDGWGPAKISFALRGKGVSSRAIDDALSQIDVEKAGERLKKLLEVKSRSLEGDSQKKLKLIKFALSRGYGYDQIKSLL